MRRLGKASSIIGLIVLASGASAWATSTGFLIDLPAMPFQYIAAPSAGGKVGTITIAPGQASNLIVQQLDLGSDDSIGGGGTAADSVLDLAKISLASNFDSSLQGDVYKLGTNTYEIRGTVLIADITGNLSTAAVQADFVTSSVGLTSGFFSFEADLSPKSGNDAILQPGSQNSWVFTGVGADTSAFPNLDGVLGQISLASDRSYFNQGTCSAGYYTYAPTMNLDSFFGSDRSSVSIDTKTVITPEPSSVLAMFVLAGLVVGKRKRA